MAHLRAEIRIVGSNGALLAYASSVDNRTGDPVMQVAWVADDD